MTEPTPAVESTQAPEAPRRGRPRPDTTIQRDEQVRTAIGAEGKTREDLATETGLTKSEVYLSLHRLRKQGLVERTRDGGKHVWKYATPAA
jgi:CRP-like cAMP-binding protein